MKSLFFILTLLLIIGSASAVRLSPIVRYNNTLSVGGSDSFDITMYPDPDTVTFEQVSVEGDCQEWIGIEKESLTVDDMRVIPVTVQVPTDTTNGAHRCDILFESESQGMVSLNIGFPVTVNVINGAEPPGYEEVPEQEVITPEEEPVTTTTVVAEMPVITDAPTPVSPMVAPTPEQYLPSLSVIAGVFVLVCVVLFGGIWYSGRKHE